MKRILIRVGARGGGKCSELTGISSYKSMTPINPVLESNQSRRRTEGPVYWSPGSTAHLNAFWYPFCFPWKERFHYTFFYYWMEDSAEGNSDGSKIKRWHFNYRTLIKARGWWLWTRPPLIVPPDVLIKWDRVGGGGKTTATKKRSPGRHKAETQLGGNLGIWMSRTGRNEDACPNKARSISQEEAPPDEILERPGCHPSTPDRLSV